MEKLCPQFHISLQSGCDSTLKRMNRKYTTKEYLRSVELLRENLKDVAVTTDVMVGFPGRLTRSSMKHAGLSKKFFLQGCMYSNIPAGKARRRHLILTRLRRRKKKKEAAY